MNDMIIITFGILVLLLIVCVVVYVCISTMYTKSFGSRPEMNRGHYTYFYDYYEMKYPREEVTFSGSAARLHGFIYGEENHKALVVVAHGIGAYHEDYMSSIIWFVDHGYRVFAVDFTGSGHSEGKGTMGLPQSAIDMDTVLSFIEADSSLNQLPKVLFGHSWGAYAVAAVLNFQHDVKAVVTVAGFNDPVHQIGEVFVMLLGKFGKLLYPFLNLFHLIQFGKNGFLRAVDGINKAGIPILIVQGMEDQLNAPNGTSIYAAREKITNPKVKYHILTKEHCSDHLSPFHTDEANEKLWHMAQDLTEINSKYQGQEQIDKTREYYESFDKEIMSIPNEKLYIVVDTFYNDALA